jgi:hypothetical protein
MEWYIDEAVRRFRGVPHPELELWGFYWMNEDIQHQDAAIVQAAARGLHDRGLRFLWIPYYRAPGYAEWREFGFDVAILQPNYAFLEQHGGRIRSDRLIETAAIAASLGMGVEVEAGSILDDPRARQMFREYLAFGGDALCGYGRGSKAYYQGGEYFRELYLSDDPDALQLYREVADFVCGRAVALPGALGGACRIIGPWEGHAPAPELTDGLLVTPLHPGRSVRRLCDGDLIEIEFPRSQTLGELEVSVVTEGMASVSGLLEAEVREGGVWSPAGWRRVFLPPEGAVDPTQAPAKRVVPVPVGGVAAEAVRLRLTGSAAELTVDEILGVVADSPAFAVASHLALGASYQVSPDAPRAYPDAGRLTDGEVSTEGFLQGRSVGWHGTEVVISVDLGRVYPVDEVVLHCDGGGSGGVHFPRTVSAELSIDAPQRPHILSGVGSAPGRPAAVAFVRGHEAEVLRAVEVAPGISNSQGRLALRQLRQAARYVTLWLEPEGWLMVSEIEVLAGRANVAVQRPYQCWPKPRASEEVRYADDGVILTDGSLAVGFEPVRLVGWSEGVPEVVIDLGVPCAIEEVIVHALGGGMYGIVAPSAMEVSLSQDGQTWSVPQTVDFMDPGGGAAQHVPISAVVDGTGRFVRVRLTTAGGWIMISEIEVH